jgi:hypothetical protein
MRSTLQARVAKLETQRQLAAPIIFRYGWLKPLPSDYVGERHVVIIKRERTDSSNKEWYHFEERPGPGPKADDDGACTVYLTEADTRI